MGRFTMMTMTMMLMTILTICAVYNDNDNDNDSVNDDNSDHMGSFRSGRLKEVLEGAASH